MKTPAIMGHVLLALAPGAAALAWFFGPGVLYNLAVATATALLVEAALLWARGRPVLPSLGDGSALVAACILALALPPLLPWWITALGVACGLTLGKHLYGGLGHNLFNPAMTGYVAVLLAFPREISLWPAPRPEGAVSAAEALRYTVSGSLPGERIDTLTHATPLDRLTTGALSPALHDGTLLAGAAGVWIWVAAAFLAGGAWLLLRGCIDWRLPLGVLAGTAGTASLLWAVIPGAAPPDFHLLTGATVLVAFFIATDPVTAPASRGARLLFALGIGITAVAIREFGAFPDGFAFAVLLMNAAAPLFDYIARPGTVE